MLSNYPLFLLFSHEVLSSFFGYSATVTLFKVGGHPARPSGPLCPQDPCRVPQCPSLPLTVHSLSTHTPRGGPRGVQSLLTLSPPQVKWIFSSAVELKRTIVPDYRNIALQGGTGDFP